MKERGKREKRERGAPLQGSRSLPDATPFFKSCNDDDDGHSDGDEDECDDECVYHDDQFSGQ